MEAEIGGSLNVDHKLPNEYKYYDLRSKRLLDVDKGCANSSFHYTVDDLAAQLTYGLMMGSSLTNYVTNILLLDSIHIMRNTVKLQEFKSLVDKIVLQMSLIYQLCIKTKNVQRKNKFMCRKSQSEIQELSSFPKKNSNSGKETESPSQTTKVYAEIIEKINSYFSLTAKNGTSEEQSSKQEFLSSHDDLLNTLNEEQKNDVEELIVNNQNFPVSPLTLVILTGNKALSFVLGLCKEILAKPCYHYLAELFFYGNAMKAFEDGVFNVFRMENDDVFYLKPTDEDRVSFYQNVYKITPEDPEDLRRRVEILYQGISLCIACAYKNKDKSGFLAKIIDFCTYSPAYLLSKRHRTTKFREFVAAHDYDLTCNLLKSINSFVPEKACTMMCPGIEYHKVIYIPRIRKTLTISGLKKTLQSYMSDERKESMDLYDEVHPIYSSRKYMRTVKKKRSTLFFNKENDLTKENGDFKAPGCEYQEENERLLKLRIISPTDLEIVDEMDKLRFKPMRKVHKVKAIIIHIHGGGFVTMSSGQHQTYTRQWVRDVGIPVFMISYRLSPECKYPDALDDCWQTYSWTIEYCKDALGIEPEKVFLSGDSAGGNLAVALTALTICKRERVPDSLFVFYPALLTWLRGFIPSRILSFDDHILNYTMLTFCLNAYCKGIKSEEHEFMSPMILPDKVLKKFPSFKCVVAGLDPLRDDGYKFAYRIHKLGGKVSLAEYTKLPHGFLNYDMFPFLAKESNQAIKQSAMWFKLEMTKKTLRKSFGHRNLENYVIYQSKKLHNEGDIAAEVQSEVPLWKRVINKATLPFLKLLF
ncbi:unnamed protein product [Moneuplotes crassus]|uniref:Alpha/beta hydrolase fold-3 domain-containing protein n=1 Tax=Euplotes crassus TaxID=5936 RepID=A0AAD1Y3L1_EUPCR|nr:unnamed protein product [Moneuplotes crassus]